MKKLFFCILVLCSAVSVYSADVSVNGKLTTWAGTNTNATDFDSDASDSVGYAYINGELNTSVSLADNVKVLLELELNDKVSNGASMNSSTNRTVEVDEANVEISQFLMDSLTLKVGHQYFEYTLRGDHRAVVLNDDFTGFKGTFKFEKGFLDVFYGKYVETLFSVNNSADSEVYGVHFEWNFTENIHTIFYLNNASFDNASADHSNYITFGAGAQVFLVDKKLELFLELAGQSGQISESVDQSGLAADAGVRWKFDMFKGFWVEANVGYRSGEDDDSDSSAFWNGMTSKLGAFIAESNYSDDSPLYAGYANDQYLAIRGEANVAWTEKWNTSALVGYFDNTNEDADPYGIEIDLSTAYQHTENLKFAYYVGVFLPDDGDSVLACALATTVVF